MKLAWVDPASPVPYQHPRGGRNRADAVGFRPTQDSTPDALAGSLAEYNSLHEVTG